MSQTPKDIALSFLQLVANDRVDEAYALYIDISGKHHNVYTASGFDALKQAMKESHAESPNKELVPHSIICEGDLVAVHSQLIRASGPDISVVHMFRIPNGKIVEMWDCGMPIPLESLNTDGAF